MRKKPQLLCGCVSLVLPHAMHSIWSTKPDLGMRMRQEIKSARLPVRGAPAGPARRHVHEQLVGGALRSARVLLVDRGAVLRLGVQVSQQRGEELARVRRAPWDAVAAAAGPL